MRLCIKKYIWALYKGFLVDISREIPGSGFKRCEFSVVEKSMIIRTCGDPEYGDASNRIVC